jgi:cbb3-type cytochrome oxidase subunit 3
MYREFFRHSTVLSLPTAAMLIFFVTFLAVVAFAVRRRATSQFNHMAALPLEDGEESGS